MKPIPIKRKARLAPADFARDHLQCLGLPVVVTDAIDAWPARSKWTFDLFKTAFGSDLVFVSLGGIRSKASKLTKFSAFIDYLDSPTQELPGFWVNTKDGAPMEQPPEGPLPVHYLLDWFAFKAHPELFNDIMPAPYFVADWVLSLSPTLRQVFECASAREYWSVYIGPKDTVSKLHCDFWRTHACLTQIQGRKRIILFSPTDSRLIYDGAVDPEQPDTEQFPLFQQATPYVCDLEPGEMLFIPPDWWHYVRALDKSITVTHNFFNDVNFGDHMAALFRRLPAVAAGFAEAEHWREELRIAWKPEDLLRK